MSTLKQALTHSLKELVAELDQQGRQDDADDLIETYIDAVRLAQMQPAPVTNQVGPAPAMPVSAAPVAPAVTTTTKDPQALQRNMSRMQQLKAMAQAVRKVKSASTTVIADAQNYYAGTRDKVQKWRNFLKGEDFKMGLEAFRDQNGYPTMRSAYNAYMHSNQLKQDYAMSSGGGMQFGASPSMKPAGM